MYTVEPIPRNYFWTDNYEFFLRVLQGTAIKVILDTGLEDPPAHQDPRPLESKKVVYPIETPVPPKITPNLG